MVSTTAQSETPGRTTSGRDLSVPAIRLVRRRAVLAPETAPPDPDAARRLRHCRRLGLLGSIMLLLSGPVAGIVPSADTVLQQERLRDMWTVITPAVALVYTGLWLLILGWWRLGRLFSEGHPPAVRELVVTFAWWGAPLLLSLPMFSQDVYSYITQGTMTALGVDAYQYGPRVFGGPLAADVPPIWQTAPAPYGPVFLSLAADVTRITGEASLLGVYGMRVLALVGVALLFFAVPRVARVAGVDPSYALWLGVLNPVVVVHFIGDAHNDALMVGLMMAGLALTVERRPAMAAVLLTLAALVKAPAGLGLAFAVLVWATQLTGRLRHLRAGLATAAIAGGTLAAMTALAGTGFGWVKALATPTKALTWTSVTTDLGHLTGYLGERLGVTDTDQMLTVWRLVGLAGAAAICLYVLHRHRTNPALGVGIGLAAVVVFSPVLHPWYALWAIVPIAASATSGRVRRLTIVAILIWSVLVYPGGVKTDFFTILGMAIAAAVALAVWAAGTRDPADDPLTATLAAVRGLTPSVFASRLRTAWVRIGKDQKPHEAGKRVPLRQIT